MTTRSADTTIATSRGLMPAHVIEAEHPVAGIVIVPSVFGVDEEMKRMALPYAEHGFDVVLPDVFWPDYPGPLQHDEPSQRERALERYERYDVEWGVEAVEASAAFLKEKLPNTRGFGVVGYCFGGRYAFLAAARSGASVVASFHGTRIGLNLDEASQVTCPVSFHFGEADPSVPMAEVAAIAEVLAFNAQAEIVSYPGVKHGFTQPSRPTYDPDVTSRSLTRALKALELSLG